MHRKTLQKTMMSCRPCRQAITSNLIYESNWGIRCNEQFSRTETKPFFYRLTQCNYKFLSNFLQEFPGTDFFLCTFLGFGRASERMQGMKYKAKLFTQIGNAGTQERKEYRSLGQGISKTWANLGD